MEELTFKSGDELTFNAVNELSFKSRDELTFRFSAHRSSWVLKLELRKKKKAKGGEEEGNMD